MKLRKLFAVLLTLMLVLGLLAGCGAKSAGSMESPFYNGDYLADRAPEASIESNSSLKESADGTSQSGALKSQKLIKTVTINAETEELDTLLANIDTRITELNGYVEARQVYNGNPNSSRSRYADLTVRIPVDALDQFVDHVSEASNIVSSNEDTQDVTLTYVATESRINALRTEEKRLLELLAKAQTMDDLLLIEARLSEVRAELEKHTSQLRLYDNLVDYGTVHLSITETQVFTVVEEETLWQRIGSGLRENWKSLAETAEDVFVFLVTSLPYLIPLAAAGALTILVVKLANRKKPVQKEKSQEEKE